MSSNEKLNLNEPIPDVEKIDLRAPSPETGKIKLNGSQSDKIRLDDVNLDKIKLNVPNDEKIKLNAPPNVSETTLEDQRRAVEASAITEKLNNIEFMRFMAAHPDADSIDMNSPESAEVVNQRFETFKAKKEVVEGLEKLYRGEIKNAAGIELQPGDLADLSAEFERRALEDPASIMDLRDKLRTASELPAKVSRLEAQSLTDVDMRVLERQYTMLKEQRENLSVAKKSIEFGGLFALMFRSREATKERVGVGTLREALAAQGAVRQDFGARASFDNLPTISAEIDAKLKAATEKLVLAKNSAKANQIYKAELAVAKEDLLSSVSQVGAIREAVAKRINKSMRAMVSGDLSKKSVTDLEQARERFGLFVELSAASPELGIDFDPSYVEAVEISFDAAISEKVSSDILRSIENTRVTTSGYSKLDQALQGFLNIQKIGSREADEARMFVIGTIAESIGKLGQSRDDLVKRMWLNQILIKAQKPHTS